MRTLFITLSLLLGCSSATTINKNNLVKAIDGLHGKKVTKQQILEKLSIKFQDHVDYIILPSKHSSEFVNTIFIFNRDSEQTLKEVSLYSFPNQLEGNLAQINCKWNRKEEYKSLNQGHTLELVKEGVCVNRNISFSFQPKMSQYLIKWQW